MINKTKQKIQSPKKNKKYQCIRRVCRGAKRRREKILKATLNERRVMRFDGEGRVEGFEFRNDRVMEESHGARVSGILVVVVWILLRGGGGRRHDGWWCVSTTRRTFEKAGRLRWLQVLLRSTCC